jgi:hypothetical protein
MEKEEEEEEEEGCVFERHDEDLGNNGIVTACAPILRKQA